METNRRDFLRAMGAAGLGLGAAVRAAASQAAAKPRGSRLKMVMRGDDVGDRKSTRLNSSH
jgi:hypothetical protein